MSAMSFRHAVGFYCLVFVFLSYPYWMLGDVVSPSRQLGEVASTTVVENSTIENPKFNDYVLSFVPEVRGLADAPRSGWLALWSKHNELGRPFYHLSVFTPAYFPTWIAGKFVSNPYRLMTLFGLGFAFCCGLFVILLCQELSLSALSALVAAVAVSTSPLFMYWLTFPMSIASYCWSAGCMYSITRMARKQDVVGWVILAFCIYSLIMTGRKQAVVAEGYIVGFYTLSILVTQFRCRPRRAVASYVMSILTAVAIGGIMTLPGILDLQQTAANSVRRSVDTSFFVSVLPEFESLSDVERYLALLTYPELYGNPISTSYPFTHNGLSFTPLALMFAILGMVLCWRQTWGWSVCVLIFAVMTLAAPVFGFAVDYLGFGLSRSYPLGRIMLPLTLLVAYGVEVLLEGGSNRRRSAVTGAALGLIFVSWANAINVGVDENISIEWGVLALQALVLLLLLMQYRSARPLLLVVALLLLVISVSRPLMLRQDVKQIANSSSLVEAVRAHQHDGSRFAIVSPGVAALRPNFNGAMGIASIHSYNSLSSTRYHRLIESLNGKMNTYGRGNAAVAPDYNGGTFWVSNVGLVLSMRELRHANLEHIKQEGGIHLYKVKSRMGAARQVIFDHRFNDGGMDSPGLTAQGSADLGDPRLLAGHPVFLDRDLGDIQEYDIQRVGRSVLLLSQQYHPDWEAYVLRGGDWVPASTTAINGVFQGVLLPENSQKVRLEFRPYSRYFWLAHVFWSVMIVLVALKFWKSRKSIGAEGV